MYKCKYCGKECQSKNSLIQHEIRCTKNPNRINCDNSTNNLAEYTKKLREGLISKNNTNQYTKAKNLGLSKPEMSIETREKLSRAMLGKNHTAETKDKISKSMQRAVREHPESYSASNVNGRVKKIKYKDIYLDSSWEVIVAKYLDSLNIIWEKPTIGFNYIYDNNPHIYYPDFYLPQYDRYIEVKGHKRQRDLAKWESVPNLIIISKKEISDIENNTYKLPL